jgi:ornithine carbamoyltransferase
MIKNFIDIKDYNKKDLREILNFANKIKNNEKKYCNLLKSKSLGLLFNKPSTRTKVSFDIGMKKLGGNVIDLDLDKIGFETRESSEDILKVLSQYLDCLVIRNDSHKQLVKFASLNAIPIINGLSNYSHPCQILSDVFTIEECLGKIDNLVILWIGDFNNVLISLIQAAEIFKFKLNILVPNSILKTKNQFIKKNELKYSTFYKDFNLGLKDVDCVMTDVWISMGERKNKLKKETLKKYQVNEKIMRQVKKDAIFMHCLPAHRNQEVTDSVIDGKNSVILKQAQNRMYVQQSIMNFLLNRKK